MLKSDKEMMNYTHFCVLPLQLVGAWDWFPKPTKLWHRIINHTYLALVLFVLVDTLFMLTVHLYSEYVDPMSAMEKTRDSLPYTASVFVVAYFATNRQKLYKIQEYMNMNFKYHSARGLSNMTMDKSYKSAKFFSYSYTACSLCSSWMYALAPLLTHFWTKKPPQSLFYMDVTKAPYIELTFLRQFLAQTFLGLALGQLGVYFAAHAILICGQLDILCCSLRNARFTALLQDGVQHGALRTFAKDLQEYEQHYFLYNTAELQDSQYHYDEKVSRFFEKQLGLGQYDIYSPLHDASTERTLRACAHLSQALSQFKDMFESFVSPLLVVRVVQVTLYLCTLLYSASRKLDMVTVEYLMAVALDIFIYCYYGNQIIIQASRVSTSAYQCWWHTMGPRPRRLLLNILLANKRPVLIKAGSFLPMHLATYVAIIKTSFSYYTLLANVNDRKNLH